jgi:hypothetical protein
MPGLPYSNPVTLYEVWRNILHDMGFSTTDEFAYPIEMVSILKSLDYGLYGTTLGVYGSGVDGSLIFSANANGNVSLTLWNGATLQASNNTFTLAQDLWLADQATINSGVTINANGFRVFCQGELINNGSIQSNGTAGANNVAGAALTYTSTLGNSTVGSAGGAGGTNNGTNAANQTAPSLGGAGGAGGNSNNGAASTQGLGGGTNASNVAATVELPFALPLATLGRAGNATAQQTFIFGGAGGGGGAGDGTNHGGGGGGGGGVVMVAAQRLGGNGNFQANGGAGGNNNNAGNQAGGGGGGGGVVIVVSRSVLAKAANSSGPLLPTTLSATATGGAGGLAVGTANNGVAGNNGLVVLLPA